MSSVIVLPFTYLVFQIFPAFLGPKWGYITGFLAYWLYAALIALLSGGLIRRNLKHLFSFTSQGIKVQIIHGAAFIPVAGVFFISFLPNVAHLTATAALLLFGMAVINGIVEEYYWRGLYLLEFSKNRWVGYVISPILFGAYHVSLWFIKGITYQGGFMALVGGAYIMGLLWTWVARKTGNIRSCTVAHIMVNIFAFTGLFVDNGF